MTRDTYSALCFPLKVRNVWKALLCFPLKARADLIPGHRPTLVPSFAFFGGIVVFPFLLGWQLQLLGLAAIYSPGFWFWSNHSEYQKTSQYERKKPQIQEIYSHLSYRPVSLLFYVVSFIILCRSSANPASLRRL